MTNIIYLTIPLKYLIQVTDSEAILSMRSSMMIEETSGLAPTKVSLNTILKAEPARISTFPMVCKAMSSLPMFPVGQVLEKYYLVVTMVSIFFIRIIFMRIWTFLTLCLPILNCSTNKCL